MVYLIFAQAARIASIWVANQAYKKILKSIALASVGMYLAERVQKQKERENVREIRDTRTNY